MLQFIFFHSWLMFKDRNVERRAQEFIYIRKGVAELEKIAAWHASALFFHPCSIHVCVLGAKRGN